MMRIVAISVRVLGGGFAALFLLSIMVSALSSADDTGEPAWVGQWDSLTLTNLEEKSCGKESLMLINEQTAQTQKITLPGTDRWGLLGVSPWQVDDQPREAVGHCRSLGSSVAGETVWGLARISLSDGKVLERAGLEVLPTSRPCWLPSLPNAILFTAGDGRLHRFQFRGDDVESDTTDDVSGSENPSCVAVTWKNPPERNDLHFNDPSWMTDPRNRRILLVSVIDQPFMQEQASALRSRSLRANSHLWWLELSEDGLTIEQAGLLVGDDLLEDGEKHRSARYPRLGTNAKGESTLYYLSRSPEEESARLEALPIQFDSETGRPQVDPAAKPTIIAQHCASTPFIVASAGESIYRVSKLPRGIVRERLNPPAIDERDVEIASRP